MIICLAPFLQARTRILAYDARGNKIAETDENSNVTIFLYDNRNRLIEQRRRMTDPQADSAADLVTTHAYNFVDSRVVTTDPNGQASGKILWMAYDPLQRLIWMMDQEGGVSTFEYSKAFHCGTSGFLADRFKPTRTVDPEGWETLIYYDELYRPSETYAEYQPNTLSSPGNNARYAYAKTEYDAVGNPTHQIVYEDFVGEPFSDPLNPAFSRDTETIFDALYRPIEVRFPDANGNPDPNTRTKTVYTSAGLTWKTEDEENRVTEMEYDAAGRAVKLIQPEVWDEESQSNQHPITLSAYDDNGNVVKTTNPRGFEWDSEFDQRNRQIKRIQPELTPALGRPAMETKYDGVGSVVEIKDAKGFVTKTAYDRANRPVEVLQPEVDKPGGGRERPKTVTAYDKNGNALRN